MRSDLLARVQRRVAETSAELTPSEVAGLVREEAGVISDGDVLEVLRSLRDDSTGFGPLEPLLAVAGVTDIVVNGPDSVWLDRGSGVEPSDMHFPNDEAVRRLATRLAVLCGRRLDDAHPYADGRIARSDGTAVRLHALLSPPSESGTCLSLRVLRQATTSLSDLQRNGTMPEEIAQLLRAMIGARHAFLVVGGTGSGKTTLLSALLAEVSTAERILCIEDTPELHPRHPHVVTLVTRQANTEGAGGIDLATLLRQGLRMRPDRIVVGEIRGAEIVDLLAAFNTGHDGGAGTLHANTLAELPARVEALAALGGMDRPAAHSQLIAGVRVIIVMRRMREGQRVVSHVGLLHRGARGEVDTRTLWNRETGASPEFSAYLEELA